MIVSYNFCITIRHQCNSGSIIQCYLGQEIQHVHIHNSKCNPNSAACYEIVHLLLIEGFNRTDIKTILLSKFVQVGSPFNKLNLESEKINLIIIEGHS